MRTKKALLGSPVGSCMAPFLLSDSIAAQAKKDIYAVDAEKEKHLHFELPG